MLRLEPPPDFAEGILGDVPAGPASYSSTTVPARQTDGAYMRELTKWQSRCRAAVGRIYRVAKDQ